MKIFRLNSRILTGLAVGMFALMISVAKSEPPKRFGRFANTEWDEGILKSLKVQNQRSLKITDRGSPVPAPPTYPHYRMIDLGTFGGPSSAVLGASVELNKRGNVIAQLSTNIPDPYCLSADCLIYRGAVRETNGVVRDLGALAPSESSVPIWISATGLITGFSTNGLVDPLTDFPESRAVFWNHDRSILDLGTLGGNSSQGLAVNSRGQVVGYALNTVDENPAFTFFAFWPVATQVRAFLWQNGSMHDLGTLGGNDSNAVAVNERGRIVGFSYTNTTPNVTTGIPTLHPFVWENGAMRDLGSLGGTLSIPGSLGLFGGTRVVNDSGDVAGTSMFVGDEVWHAFLWSDGRMIDLGTLGGSKSDAVAINNKTQVVGRAVVTDTPFVRHAFLWEKGQMTDLGAVAPCQRSTAQSINSSNQIVGSLGFCTDNPDELNFNSAFYVEKDKPMVDLNTLITPPSPVHLDEAWNINNRGEIFGSGLLPDGSTRAVLLVPIPPGQ